MLRDEALEPNQPAHRSRMGSNAVESVIDGSSGRVGCDRQHRLALQKRHGKQMVRYDTTMFVDSHDGER